VYADRKVSLPITEAAAAEVLSLPIFPELSSANARAIAGRVVKALADG
jgi:dTDP-4-amino-4,6-dideoxygalactose transaminase